MAPVAVELPAGAKFCLKREGIGGYYGKLFQRGDIVGIFINLNCSLVKNSLFVILYKKYFLKKCKKFL
jgi:hypothetical protein